MNTKAQLISLSIAGAIVAMTLSAVPASPAAAHIGYASNFVTQADCEENRRMLARSGHITQACVTYKYGSGVRWLHYYGH